MFRRGLAVVLALSVTASVALADSDPIADAEAAVASGQLVKAASIIDAGLVENPGDLKLLFLRGVVELQRRRFASALAAYETYLAAGPRGPNARKARRIIDNLAVVKTTFLEVEVTGGGAADVYVDDKSLGVYCVANAVCTVGMMPGRYRLYIEGQGGGAPVTRDVVVEAGRKTRVTVELAGRKAPLTIRATPADAEIIVDGVLVGSGERTVEVTAGQHRIEVRRSGFATIEREVAVAGDRSTVEIALPERVPLAGLPAGVKATFELDGQPVELSGNAIAVPSDGRAHQLVIRAPGYRETAVSLRAGRDGEPLVVSLARDTGGPRQAGWSGGRKAAFISMLAAGGVGIAAGSLLGLQVIGKRDEAEDHCDDTVCDQRGLDLLGEARSRATLSNVAFGVAAAAVVGAAVVWLTAPSDSEGLAVGASVDPDGAAVSVRLGF